MTVEQLIEMLQEQEPLALVLIEIHPCTVFWPPDYRGDGHKGTPVAVYRSHRNQRVYIEAQEHDC